MFPLQVQKVDEAAATALPVGIPLGISGSLVSVTPLTSALAGAAVKANTN